MQAPTSEQRSNFRYLYADIFWWGVLSGSTLSFLAVFLTRLGASGFQLGALTAGPALVNLLFSLPFGRWLENKPFIKSTFWSSVAFRLGYFLLIPIPLLFTPQQEIALVLLVTILMSIPGTLLAIVFNAAFAEVVPPEHRATVVGRRNALVSFSMVASSLLCGQILIRVDFPINYVIVFAIGALGAALSSYYLARLRLTGREAPLEFTPIFPDLSRPGRLDLNRILFAVTHPQFPRRLLNPGSLRLSFLRGPFGLFLLAYLAFYLFQNFPVAIFPQYFVRDLNLTDSHISLGTSLFYFSMLLASMSLRRASLRLGNHKLLFGGAFFYGLYPLILALARGVELYLVASFIGGTVWGYINGAIVNRLLERSPVNELPTAMALHNLVLNLGLLLGSFSGPVVSEAIGLRPALYVSSFLRAIGALAILLWA